MFLIYHNIMIWLQYLHVIVQPKKHQQKHTHIHDMLQLEVCFFKWIKEKKQHRIHQTLGETPCDCQAQVTGSLKGVDVPSQGYPNMWGFSGEVCSSQQKNHHPQNGCWNLLLREIPPNKNLKQIFRFLRRNDHVYTRKFFTCENLPLDSFSTFFVEPKKPTFRGFQIFVVEFPGWKILFTTENFPFFDSTLSSAGCGLGDMSGNG